MGESQHAEDLELMEDDAEAVVGGRMQQGHDGSEWVEVECLEGGGTLMRNKESGKTKIVK